MSRTLKRVPEGYFRRPKGHRQALLEKARTGKLRRRAIPPSYWDDVQADKQCYVAMKVADGLAAKGVSYGEIVRKLMGKFGMRLGYAEWTAEMSVLRERRRIPEGLLAVYQEKELLQ